MKKAFALLVSLAGFSVIAFADNSQTTPQQGTNNAGQSVTQQQQGQQQSQQNSSNDSSSPENDADPEADQK